ncbi:apolipoprotein N-acyltransferase [Yoonia sp.]|uniref:apolipoprotein N-acyltransferase n=1 Tax=Yoonia sp. TaxID=2212373 RepID=UPI002FDA036F
MADIVAWFAGQRGRVRFAVLAALGVVAGLGQAPLDLWPVTLIALAFVLVLSDGFGAPRKAGAALWVFGIGYFGFSLRWIVEPFLVDIARHGWMAPFALVLMAAGAGLFWALAGWVTARLRLGRWGLAMTLTGVEVLRSLILTGFPWALLGHVWIETSVAQLAAFGGPHLLTLVTVVAALALAGLFARGWRIVSGVGLAGLAVAALTLAPPQNPGDIDGPIVRMVQPNAPQAQKWDPAYRDLFLNRSVRLTAEGDVPDLVVWPETSVPYLLNFVEDDLSLLADAARGAPLVFGIQRFDDDRNIFNSLVLMEAGAKITAIYDKRHLVPFGEYFPGAGLLGNVGMAGLVGSGFTPGTAPALIDIPGIGSAIPLICYEGIFAEEIVADISHRRLLLLITNDAWFGKAAGPLQHLAQARLRAIEQGLPMVRVANTGVSAMIDPYGRITASLPLGVDGALDAPLPPALAPTLYAHFGDGPVITVLILLLGAGFLRRKRDSD